MLRDKNRNALEYFNMNLKNWFRPEIIIPLVIFVLGIPLALLSGIFTPEGRGVLFGVENANNANNQITNINSRTDTNNNVNANNSNTINANALKPPGIKSPTPTPTPTATPTPTPTPTIPNSKPEPIIRENVVFDFLECRLANGNVICKFKITNKGVNENFRFYGKSSIQDDKGTKLVYKTQQVGNSTRPILLLTDKPVEAIIEFGGASKDISYIGRLFVEFAVTSPHRILKVELTDIPLLKQK